MRENNLLDFNMYEQTMSQNVRQSDGAYAERDCSPPTLTTKDITENGEYSAADDGAVGYSSVTVDVSSGGGDETEFWSAYKETSKTTATKAFIRAAHSDNGIYSIPERETHGGANNVLVYLTCLDPVHQFVDFPSDDYRVIFTPRSDFIQPEDISSASDTVTPGDGKAYLMVRSASSPSGPYYKTFYALNVDFYD